MDFNGLSATNGGSWATPGGAQSGRRRTMNGPPRRPALGEHALRNRDQRHWGHRRPRLLQRRQVSSAPSPAHLSAALVGRSLPHLVIPAVGAP